MSLAHQTEHDKRSEVWGYLHLGPKMTCFSASLGRCTGVLRHNDRTSLTGAVAGIHETSDMQR